MIKHYLQVYLEFAKTSLIEASSYRINFILLFFVDITFYATSFTSVDFIFGHIDHIGIWERDQFMFFMSFVLVVDHLHMTFISANFWLLAESLRLGNLDFSLLKPIHSLFIVFFRYIRVSSFTSTPLVLGLLIYFSNKVNLSLTSWIMLPIMIILSFLLLAIIECTISTLMFWTTEGIGINFLRMQLQKMGHYPNFIYQTWTRRFFTFALPILIAGSAPVHFLLNPAHQWTQLFSLIIANLITGFALLKIWNKALLSYESASS